MGDIQFNGTQEEWDALVKKNKEQEEILQEIQKCKDSPYYFVTKYCTVKTGQYNMMGEEIVKPFTTHLTEEEFNNIVKNFKT